jgi:hypothetical protein
MARADLSNLFNEQVKPLEQVRPVDPPDTAAVPPSISTQPSEVAQGRINFEIARNKRAAFKAWCAQNDTSIRDELTSHIDRILEGQ